MNTLPILLALSLSSSVLAAEPSSLPNPHAGMTMQAAPHAGMSAMTAPDVDLTQRGSVQSAINVSEYTYIEVSQNNKTRWLAATRVDVKKGDTIRFDEGTTMANFYSKSLKRSFPDIAFVNRVEVIAGKK